MCSIHVRLPEMRSVLTEKAAIILADPRTLINEKSEILSGCRHRARYKYATSPACK